MPSQIKPLIRKNKNPAIPIFFRYGELFFRKLNIVYQTILSKPVYGCKAFGM